MGGSAFSDSSFDVHGYLSNRPRYPPHLYDWIRKYVSSPADKNGLLVDVGCGPGFAAFPLLDSFRRLIGVDTSAKMVQSAPDAFRAYTADAESPSRRDVSFEVGSSASMPFVKDASADCVIAATAAHWFDYKPTWKELTRIVAPGGSVVWWTYGEHFLPDHPHLRDMVSGFMQGGGQSGDETIGPYFEQPGRGRLTNLLRDLPFPHDDSLRLDADLAQQWDENSATRRTHEIESHKDGVTQIDVSHYARTSFAERGQSPAEPFRLEQVMTWSQYEGYIRTSSALHSYLKTYPDDARAEGGDIAARFVRRLKDSVAKDRQKGVGVGEGLDESRVRVAWPLGLMAIKKKQ